MFEGQSRFSDLARRNAADRGMVPHSPSPQPRGLDHARIKWVPPVVGSTLIGFVLMGVAGCCIQSAKGTGGETSGSGSGGTASGGSLATGGVGCTIDGQFFAARVENPANAAQCCNPEIDDSRWQPLFTKVFGSPLPLGTVAFSAAIADLNGDGSDDVVAVVNLYDGGPEPAPGVAPIWIFSSFDGGFEPPVLIGSPQEIGSGATIGDLNRDGQQGHRLATGQNVYVALNRGDGQFQVGNPIPSTACQPAGLAILNHTDGGWPDVVMGTLPDVKCGLFVLPNDRTGGGALLAPQALTDEPHGSLLLLPLVGDFTGNGRADVAYQAYDENGVGLWWMASKDGGFSNPASLVDAGGDDVPVVTSFSSNSLTGLGFSYSNTLAILVPGAEGPVPVATENIDGGCWGLAAADFDGDGLPDFVCGAQTTLDILRGESATTWSSGSIISVPSAEQILWVGTGDLNGDGAPDVVLLRQNFPTSASWEGWINTCGSGAAKLLRDGGI